MRKLLNKKALSAFLAIVMTFATMAGMFTFSASADAIPTYTADTSWYTSDAADMVYEIDTPEELLGFSHLLRTKSFSGQTIKLTSDIDLNPGWDADDFYDKLVDGDSNTNGVVPPNMWTGAAIDNAIISLYGTFDGNGHTISGIYAVSSASSGTIYGRGLFGCGVGGTLKDFSIVNSCYDLSGGKDQFPGGFFGQLYQDTTKITNVYSELNLYSTRSDNAVGAFASYAPVSAQNGSVEIAGCVYNGKISSISQAAGFVGKIEEGSTTIRNSIMSGTISSQGTSAGFVGANTGVGTVTIQNCAMYGTIDCTNESLDTGVYPAAGLIHDNRGTATLSQCIIGGNLDFGTGSDGTKKVAYIAHNQQGTFNASNIIYWGEHNANTVSTNNGTKIDELNGIAAQATLNANNMTAFVATTTGYPMPKTLVKASTPTPDDNALTNYVGYQTTKVADGTFGLRLVGNLDAETTLADYDNVGFKVVAFFDNNAFANECVVTTVYNEIATNYGTTSFAQADKYVYVQECANLPAGEDITFEVTTFATASDGTTVTLGATYRFVVNVPVS